MCDVLLLYYTAIRCGQGWCEIASLSANMTDRPWCITCATCRCEL